MWGGVGKMVNLTLDLFEVPWGQAHSNVQHQMENMGLELTTKIRTKIWKILFISYFNYIFKKQLLNTYYHTQLY